MMKRQDLFDSTPRWCDLARGGTSAVITGTNFTGVTAVKFGTVHATSYVVNSATRITAVAPAGTAGTTVDVTVMTPAGTSAVSAASKYSYGVPTVTLLGPNPPIPPSQPRPTRPDRRH